MSDHLWHAFADQRRRRGDAVALMTANSVISWRRLDAAAAAVHKLLSDHTDQDQRFVVHECRNDLADVLIWIACLRSGRVDVPIDARLAAPTKRELADRVGGLVPAEFTQRLRAVTADCSEAIRWPASDASVRSPPSPSGGHDDALVLWTSGTTDHPKGVRLSNRALATNAAAKLKAVPQMPHDVRLTVLPICHAYARTCDLGTWLLSGCTLAIDRGLAGWNRLAPRVRPTLANVVPSLAKRLLSDDIDAKGLARLRLLGCGGAGLSDATFHAWRTRGVTVIQGYGLTETGPVICSATPDDAVAGSVGGLVEGWECRVEDGRLAVRGDCVMNGYLNDETATRGKIDADGWLETGDVVDIDPKTNQFRILGRCDDVIVMPNGTKIHPASIEQRLRACAGVTEALLCLRGERLSVSIATDHSETHFRQVREACETVLGDLPLSRADIDVRPWSIDAAELAELRTAKGTLKRHLAKPE